MTTMTTIKPKLEEATPRVCHLDWGFWKTMRLSPTTQGLEFE